MANLLQLFAPDKDRELSDLRAKYRTALQSLSSANQQVDRLIEQNLHGEHEVNALTKRVGGLEAELRFRNEELRACKDDLFRLQPMSHVPDSKIAEQFESLDDAVSTWIDAQVARHADRWQQQYPDIPPRFFLHGGNPYIKELLTNYADTAGEHIIHCVLQRQLYKRLFNEKIYLFGSGKEVAILEVIEKEMQQLQPPRDAKTVRAWRSEALTSLVASRDFSERLTKKCEQLANDTFDYVTAFFPIIKGSHTSLEDFYHKIIQPAVSLALAIQTSPTPYYFGPRMTGTSITKKWVLTKEHLTCVKMIDAKTGKTLKAESPLMANEDGYIGQQIAPLAPALRRHLLGQNSVGLTQEVLLVELFYPLGRRRANTVQPQRPTSNRGELLE